MKRMMMWMALVAIFAGNLMAQGAKQANKAQRPGNFAEMQLKQVVKALKLDDKTTAAFTPLYREYQKALRDCRTQRPRKKAVEMTDAELDRKIKDDFAQSRKMLDVKEKFYGKFKKVLTVKQINALYRVERSNLNRLSRERMNRHGNHHRRAMGNPNRW